MTKILNEIEEYNEYYNITKPTADMKNSEYKALLNDWAFFFRGSCGSVLHTLSGQPVATNRDQLDLLIEHLNIYRNTINDADPKYHKD